MKTHTTLSVEPNLLEKAKKEGINLSDTFENAIIERLHCGGKVAEIKKLEEEEWSLRKQIKIKEQYEFARQFIKDCFKMLTGLDMSDEEFQKYHERFKEEVKGWNLKNYIEESGLKILT
jgi:post-segregation antitoxin (ccd killing protein)